MKPTGKPKPARTGKSTVKKIPSVIRGLDVIPGGGMPKGRSARIIRGHGYGKTRFARAIIARGITGYNEYSHPKTVEVLVGQDMRGFGP